MTRVTSIRLSEELCVRLDVLAASLDRPRTWLIEQAITRYLDEESWQVTAIAEALESYRNGTAKLTPHDEVMREMREQIRSGAGHASPLA